MTQNGILVMGIAALAILFWTRGSVTLLVVLYSVSVFLTFAISLFGLCLYWWNHRAELQHWKRRFLLSLIGFVICAGILGVLLVEKFADGGWAAVLIIAAIVFAALAVLADKLAKYIPFKQELEISSRFAADFPAPGPVSTYLQQMSDRVVAAQELPAGMRIQVHYIDNSTINAFATLGGNVVFFRGLVGKMPSENALAMVMSHGRASAGSTRLPRARKARRNTSCTRS